MLAYSVLGTWFYQLKPPSGATVCTEPSNFKIKSPIPVSPWVRFP